MALFEIADDGLVPFRQLRGHEYFENEIERLFWENLDDLAGERLLRVRRQPSLPSGGVPDMLAIDSTGALVVFEVKRGIDRRQIAQILEYAGWAREASLEDVAGLYHRGREQFWRDWQEFTDSSTPKPLNRTPRLVLIAKDLDERTRSSFEYLQEFRVPLILIAVGLYEDSQGRRFLDLEGVEDPIVVSPAIPGADVVFEDIPLPAQQRRSIPRVAIADLVGAGLLDVGDRLTWNQPRKGLTHEAVVTPDGRLELPDGSHYPSVSAAAVAASEASAIDGWNAWRVESQGRILIDELRMRYLDSLEESEGPGV